MEWIDFEFAGIGCRYSSLHHHWGLFSQAILSSGSGQYLACAGLVAHAHSPFCCRLSGCSAIIPERVVFGAIGPGHLIQETSRFPVLVNDKNGLGIIVTYLWKEIPFVLLMSMPVYRRMDWRYEDVVRTLGGGQWQVFKTVEWPALLPVLVETGIILFAFIFSAFELPYLLGVTYPKMISVMAYQWFYEGSWSNRPLAMALMTVSTVMVLIVAVVLLGLIQGKRYRMMRGR